MNKSIKALRYFVKLELAAKTADEKITQGNAICMAMLNNSSYFIDPVNPTIAELQLITDNLEAALIAAVNAGNTQKAALANAEAMYDITADRMGFYVQSIADSDLEHSLQIIQAAAMDTRKARAKTPIPNAIEEINAIYTNVTGTILVKWKGTKYARFFNIYISNAPNGEWKLIATTPKRKTLIENLQSGMRYYIKVFVAGTNGISPESPTASCIAA